MSYEKGHNDIVTLWLGMCHWRTVMMWNVSVNYIGVQHKKKKKKKNAEKGKHKAIKVVTEYGLGVGCAAVLHIKMRQTCLRSSGCWRRTEKLPRWHATTAISSWGAPHPPNWVEGVNGFIFFFRILTQLYARGNYVLSKNVPLIMWWPSHETKEERSVLEPPYRLYSYGVPHHPRPTM